MVFWLESVKVLVSIVWPRGVDVPTAFRIIFHLSDDV